MTLEFVLSKMLQILKRFWTVDTAAQSVRRGGGDGFVRATGPAALLTQRRQSLHLPEKRSESRVNALVCDGRQPVKRS
ncbi:hypothetical protein [Mesorhizobium sp.]|uniref:hypothetical protein n=1 Tax=Mesorhizobium sp. TaxID=1871066 RepID=UPI000FEA45CE|nr:hypothetical protein [Mesorhizobium sp.]RWB35477.1 MAG: hypothetical protein EOQ41_04950 [Mesorhizobium sp.]RWD45972.1 MAG: hypothetical protein EOS35_11390 [Mesorhizobium sp.]